MRKVLIAAAGLALVYLYPVGGAVWTANQVSGLAMVQGERRVELQDPRMLEAAVRDALSEARSARLRQWLPGERCHPVELQFLTSGRWVAVRIPCSSGLLFDYIPREARR